MPVASAPRTPIVPSAPSQELPPPVALHGLQLRPHIHPSTAAAEVCFTCPCRLRQGLLAPLPIGKLRSLGGKFGDQLQANLGVTTVGECCCGRQVNSTSRKHNKQHMLT